MRCRTFIFSLAALASVVACASHSRTLESAPLSQLQLNDIIETNPLFSGNVLVAQNGDVIAHGYAGYQNRESGEMNNVDTLFSIASIGKMFTAVAVIQLVEAKKIDYNTPVTTLLPELGAQVSSDVTIDHLLHHTSGFNRGSEIDDKSLDATSNNHDLYSLVMASGVRTDGPSSFAYRNANYLILGEIIERVSGKPYETYTQQNIAAPAGMSHIIFTRLDRAPQTPIAEPYLPVDFDTWWNSEDPIEAKSASDFVHKTPPSTPTAGGGAYVTATDMLKFANALRNNRLISAESFAAMCSLSEEDTEKGRGYGRGCSIDIGEHGVRVGHTGSSAGVHARFFMYLTQGIDIVVLSNHEGQAAPVFGEIDTILRAQ